MNKAFRNIILYVLMFLAIFGVMNYFSGTDSSTTPITYDKFITSLESGKVESVDFQPKDSMFVGTGRMDSYEEGEYFTVTVPNSTDVISQINNIAREQDTVVDFQQAAQTSPWVSVLTSIIPFLLIGFLFFFMMNNARGGGGNRMNNFGKSPAKLQSNDKKKVRFRDVAGADEEKQELIEVVDFLKNPKKFTELGAHIPKGVLLVGPPGTGKTLLAKAVAGEAGVPFFSISGSDFVEMFVGVGASRVRDLFENAKKNAPCIIFIDEIDAVGRQRGAGLGGGHDEREQTLNQLLVEMDGFGGNEGVIVMAATNRSDVLDPALLRPGRFDRQITVERPDVKGREAVLKVHARNKPLDSSVDLQAIAQRTPGFSGADLENLLNEAALVAARHDKKKIDTTDIDEATDRIIAGVAKKSRVISEKERNIVAFHEAGHTVIGMVLDDAETVHKVTIVPRGKAGGYAVMLPKEDRYLMTKPELLDKITGLLGGRVAEEITFGEVSTGAHNDFQRATAMARAMVTEYGMSDKLGPLQFGKSQGEVFLGRDFGNEPNYSDTIAHEIDMEMQRFIKDSYEQARKILTENKDKLKLIAETLLKVETLNAEQIKSLWDEGKLPEEPVATIEAEEVTDSPKKEEGEGMLHSVEKRLQESLKHDLKKGEDSIEQPGKQ